MADGPHGKCVAAFSAWRGPFGARIDRPVREVTEWESLRPPPLLLPNSSTRCSPAASPTCPVQRQTSRGPFANLPLNFDAHPCAPGSQQLPPDGSGTAVADRDSVDF